MRRKWFAGVMLITLAALTGPILAEDKSVSVTGEVIDNFCYLEMGAKGESHRKCGIDCAKKGMAVGLLEEKTGKIYVLLPNKDKAPLPDAAIEKMGRTATITGHLFSRGGSQFLTVESIK